MDETTFKIMYTLARNMGRPLSINALRAKIGKEFPSAYYKNIYDKVQDLAGKGILKAEKIGKSQTITINFGYSGAIDWLTELEIEKKRRIVGKKIEIGMLFTDMEIMGNDSRLIGSISIIDPEKNMRLRRAELLILMKEPRSREEYGQEAANILRLAMDIETRHNMRLDCLIIKTKSFFNMLASKEYNPVKPMIEGEVGITYPQNYWMSIREFFMKGMALDPASELSPSKMAGNDLEYNLTRFGYAEMGGKLKKGKDICLESVIAATLIFGDARRIESIPVLLAKNKANYPLLVFLARKYGIEARLLGLLKALANIKEVTGVDYAINMLESAGVKELKADGKSIRDRMRLYNAY